MSVLTLADFAFDLPPELIAQAPVPTRTGSRLLHVAGDRLADLKFADLPDLLRAGDLLVFNDTRVIKARVHGRKPTGGKVEIMVERIVADDEAWVQLRASHAPGVGGTLLLQGEASATVVARDDRFWRLRFAGTGPLVAWLERHGDMPLPPYIDRAPGRDDDARYQTVYAREPGAVAAPTAGLHFTPELMAELDAKGVKRETVTLHVGAGTFLPVKADDTKDHVMHAEWGEVTAATAAAINDARATGHRTLCVGTTSMRTVESASNGEVQPFRGDTRLFITPGYRFKSVDMLLTNFHLPRSTLFMLVSAFCGTETMRAAYTHAIANRFRFYSYGDACLLIRRRG
jgi:S-adenosylmethionine:tRNA ribosyltransferase-isomerase